MDILWAIPIGMVAIVIAALPRIIAGHRDSEHHVVKFAIATAIIVVNIVYAAEAPEAYSGILSILAHSRIFWIDMIPALWLASFHELSKRHEKVNWWWNRIAIATGLGLLFAIGSGLVSLCRDDMLERCPIGWYARARKVAMRMEVGQSGGILANTYQQAAPGPQTTPIRHEQSTRSRVAPHTRPSPERAVSQQASQLSSARADSISIAEGAKLASALAARDDSIRRANAPPPVPTPVITPSGEITLHSGRNCRQGAVDVRSDMPAWWSMTNTGLAAMSNNEGSSLITITASSYQSGLTTLMAYGTSHKDGTPGVLHIYVDSTPCR